MSAGNVRNMERLEELLADEASAGLDATDAPELKQLLDRHPAVGRDDFMQAAALAQVAFLRRDQRSAGTGAQGVATVSRMPAGLKERLASQGEVAALRQRGTVRRLTPAATPLPVTARKAPAAPAPRPARGPFGALGWALAASLAVALLLVRNEAPLPAPETDSRVARTELVNGAPDVITLPWAPPTAAGYENVKGDVVWSQSRQQGYLRLANMPVNDPGRTQYQLWIVDPERDTHPVDGGVFNVSATGEVVIPIQAKLEIRSPKAFAITAEQPGGVVVSAGPLLVVASS
jgi:hypothetical protein